ncbi:hypothetical protein ACIPZ5_17745 [Pseudomonas sp. NPDC089428]|uniref:hypothetical protein n=1 Tax=Pseudomonas sp. NPDC089428 TaxID=3364467 RepID=UPI0037F6A9F6
MAYTQEEVQAIKDAATAKYNTQDKFTIIQTNYFVDMWAQYDALLAQGYKRAPDSYLIAVNSNLSATQIIYMEPSDEAQAAALQAIYDAIDAEYPVEDSGE